MRNQSSSTSDSAPVYPEQLLKPRPYPFLLSVVVPLFNEEAGIDHLRAELEYFAGTLECQLEIVLVDDGSSDGTLGKIVAMARRDSRVRVVHLSRNFGHQIAATAGLDYASGDATVLVDGDLQDPLPVVQEMIARYCEGYDVIYGQRESRAGESGFKRLTAWLFYRLMRHIVSCDLPVDAGDFRLLSRECLDGLKMMRETHRFLRGMVAWVGFPQVAVRYQRAARLHGSTKYPLSKMLLFAWTAATSFSTLPLRISFYLGTAVGLFAIEEAIRAIAGSLTGKTVPGWTSLMVVTSIIGSALLFSIGILGQYVGKVYEQSKDRPLYLVARTYNVHGTDFAEDRISRLSEAQFGHR
jgi:polyisoprenyl-phosphate glycosyltransferase